MSFPNKTPVNTGYFSFYAGKQPDIYGNFNNFFIYLSVIKEE